MTDINEPDDLLGMLPTEIIAAFAAERAARQAAEQAVDALLRERLANANAMLEEAISTAWSARTSRRSPEKLEFVNVEELSKLRALLAPPATDQQQPEDTTP